MKLSRLFRACHAYPTLVAIAFCAGAAPAAAEVDQADVYKMRCAFCHGTTGGGGWEPPINAPRSLAAPPLRGNPLVANAPAEAIAEIIRNGRTGPQRLYDDYYANMPPFNVESVPDILGLVEYLQTTLQEQ